MESLKMLVLSRKLNESIVIGGDIRITVVGLRGNHVRLGIEAPADVPVMREELLLPAAEHPDFVHALASRNPK
jgi:carbon storage regulator